MHQINSLCCDRACSRALLFDACFVRIALLMHTLDEFLHTNTHARTWCMRAKPPAKYIPVRPRTGRHVSTAPLASDKSHRSPSDPTQWTTPLSTCAERSPTSTRPGPAQTRTGSTAGRMSLSRHGRRAPSAVAPRCVCVCVYVCARASARACACVFACTHVNTSRFVCV